MADACLAYLDKHLTLDPVMVSVVSSIPTIANFLKFFKCLNVYFGLKCKEDLIVKSSIRSSVILNNVQKTSQQTKQQGSVIILNDHLIIITFIICARRNSDILIGLESTCNTIGGSKGGTRDARPLWVQILSFSCRFREMFYQMIG